MIRRWRSTGPAGQRAGPFAVLGLDLAAELTDDEVRAAWRRIAAATHPDLADGGDPERFAVAAAAYTELRTRYGRGEARAALAAPAAVSAAGSALGKGTARGSGTARSKLVARYLARVRLGRPARLALRMLGASGAGAAGWLAAGPGPAGPALATGALTWLVLTIRRDLSPP